MNWSITDSNGTPHSISCELKAFSSKVHIMVDGNLYKVKSSSWWVNLIDYAIDFPGANCHVVMVGRKARLAVNGTYQDDGSKYEPVARIPAWVWVLVGISVVSGIFCGLLGICAAVLLTTFVYIPQAMKRNYKAVVIGFVGYLVVIALLFVLAFSMGAAMGAAGMA